jgi:molecular chaperone DnaK (HSP70)
MPLGEHLMSNLVAIDFGTTNSVAAQWEDNHAILLTLPNLSQADADLPLVPSIVYVGQTGLVMGEQVRQHHLHEQTDNRLFRNFKRGLVNMPPPPTRTLDGRAWQFQEVAAEFLREFLRHIPVQPIDQLVMTVPVAAFEGYLEWLHDVATSVGIEADQIRIVDESTAAALGYAVQEAGALVLVVDFGGGTLDLSLVQLPEERSKVGELLGFLRLNQTRGHMAQVIAKAGILLGGSDIDQWLVQWILQKQNLTSETLGNAYAPLLLACEQAKIALSSQPEVKVHVLGEMVTITQADLQTILEQNGLFDALRHTLDKVMQVARQREVMREDVRYVLMVGGTSLIPSVQEQLQTYFTRQAVRADKPFTAVVEGALQVAAGMGLQDYVVHSYALRYLNSQGEHQYEEIIPMGMEYPSEPVELILAAAHSNQEAVEFIIGEVAADAVAMIEIAYEGEQMVFVAKADTTTERIIPINEEDRPLATLKPTGKVEEPRLKASFHVDGQRRLRVTVVDMQTRKTVLQDVVLASIH